MMQLRKACNHPFLFENDAENAERQMLSGTHTDEGIVESAGKMVVLDKILKRCKAEGRRVLVFSQVSGWAELLSLSLSLSLSLALSLSLSLSRSLSLSVSLSLALALPLSLSLSLSLSEP